MRRPREIFVFGSNLAGRHGRGAAREAYLKHGAEYGKGIGLVGDSYAIPTKDYYIRTLPLSVIKEHVGNFINFATRNPDLQFNITKVGSGLAGYNWDTEMRPLFPKKLPHNCRFIEDAAIPTV